MSRMFRIVALVAGWSRDEFVAAMREGVRPDGSQIDPVMPVQFTRHMTDLELNALYAFFMELEPRPLGEK